MDAVRLEGITKRFPGVVANDDVDLRVERGSVHALLGENGAGKTTLMNVLYGLYEPTAGEIYVDGDGIETDAAGEPVESPREFRSPRDAIDAGVGMIHQHFMLVDPMTVAENVTLGVEPTKWGGLAVDRGAARASVRELSERYGFDVDPTERIEEISVGERQRVEILKALYRGAEVLVLDEPTAVLTPQEVEELFAVFEELTAAGKTILFITHKLREAMTAADEITVLRDGRRVGTVAADETGREELAELMVGRGVVLDTETPPATPGDPTLAVEGLRVPDDRGVPAVRGTEFTVREGEIFGIAGVDGNGQRELVEAITGLREPTEGVVRLDGRDVTTDSRRERGRAGMAYVPEDRQREGLVMSFDLTDNAILGSQHDAPYATDGRIDWRETRDHAERIVSEYDVRPPDPDATAESLSGGNQQKFVVGRELRREPACLVASHPTRGVDVGSTEFIHDRLIALREAGVAVLLVSSKLDEVRALSDRLGVVHDGRLVAVTDPDRIDEETLGLLMAGERPADVPAAERPGRTVEDSERPPEAETAAEADGGMRDE
ncbi:MAG: ABC transporter ATP-binding protein [Halobaculum sp.]